MKKIFIILIMIILTCVYINISNSDSNNKTSKTHTEETSYYSSIEPVEMNTQIYEGKIIDSYLLLVKESTELNNEIFMELKNKFNFEKNTYLILNCENMDIKEIKSKALKKDNVCFEIQYLEQENYENYVIIEIKNLIINDLNIINIEKQNLNNS